MRSFIALFLITISFQKVTAEQEKKDIVFFNETYELANIILALTDYGKSDKNEINKNSIYYNEVLNYFDKFSNHPIIKKANYSRALWDKLLSFRTDAVAFEFDNQDKLHRKHKFYAMGKEINEFENNLALVEDFAKISRFRDFYKNKKLEYNRLSTLYEKSLHFDEIESFLTEQFNVKIALRHQIIVSPLVGRMHCQRPFNNNSTSFINIPDYILNAKLVEEIDEAEIASGIHMFFTEIDHDYVNPTTRKYKKELKMYFEPKKWDKGSGYEEIKNGTFNEYMTWAVYDIFIKERFPKVTDKVLNEWHSVNVSRGFFASQIFSEQLLSLYSKKAPNEKIYNLYPSLINWCREVADNLPLLVKTK